MQFYQLINAGIEETKDSCVALLGGGGKTALLHKLANEFSQKYPAVLQTSLTKTAFYKSDNPLILENIDDFEIINRNPLFIIGEKVSESKLRGISPTELDQLRHKFDVTIFECDGARNKPLKAHTDYDPIVPEFTNHVIVLIGADVVNTKISDGFVHRPELFCKIWNVNSDTMIDIDFIVKVISTKRGYLTKIQHDVNISYFVNKADVHPKAAEQLASAIFNKTAKPTFYGSIRKDLFKQVTE